VTAWPESEQHPCVFCGTITADIIAQQEITLAQQYRKRPTPLAMADPKTGRLLRRLADTYALMPDGKMNRRSEPATRIDHHVCATATMTGPGPTSNPIAAAATEAANYGRSRSR
jgi:hypothetical protein